MLQNQPVDTSGIRLKLHLSGVDLCLIPRNNPCLHPDLEIKLEDSVLVGEEEAVVW